MPCYHPIKGYRSKGLTVNGKHTFVPSSKDSDGSKMEIPCGQCIGCRLDRSREWAARISAEASLYDQNCFVTLTYSPENLPENGSLVLEHFQLFMKRLRKKYGSNIRFFHCGEYGEQLGRPHYHVCLLNFDFPDKSYFSSTPRGDRTYTSKILGELWPYGHHQIGSLSFESAAYCARYVTKKITGVMAPQYYGNKKPEYTTMSRRPGIGAPWLDKFKKDVYSFDTFIIRGGIKMKPPRAFDRRYEITDPLYMAVVRHKRDVAKSQLGSYEMRRLRLDSTEERLRVREVVHEATIKSTLKRQYEE